MVKVPLCVGALAAAVGVALAAVLPHAPSVDAAKIPTMLVATLRLSPVNVIISR